MKDALGSIELVRGDITVERVHAIVNAANPSLRGGGGVDGAIHRAAGPELLAECLRLHPEGCPTGEARLTAGHRLAARWVIHTVGPIWRGGGEDEPLLLAAAHTQSLALAAETGCRTVAFPAISTGVYGYPYELAAAVALGSTARALVELDTIERVRFVLFNDALLGVFTSALAALRAGH